MQRISLYPRLADLIEERKTEFDQISQSRKAELEAVAAYLRDRLSIGKAANLTFICTHNSRRSHLSQIWAKVAADVFGLAGVTTYSGGTEATAINSRVVDSLRRSGFEVEAENEKASNPIFRVRYSEDSRPLECFSKRYDQPPNPTADYAAVMTCSTADDACPIVRGCDLRVPIRYEDPKVADGTPKESDVYDERSRQICREMMYMVSKV